MKKYDWKRFWLSVIAVAVLSFVFFDVVATAKAEEYVITGYGPGEFAIKGEVERQLEQLVYKLGRIEQNGEGLEIKVVGSADNIGRSAANDQLAKVRAEQIAAYLETALTVFLPRTRIVSWSQGDQANVRQVKVVYTVIPASVAREKSKGKQALYLFSLCLGIAVVTVILLVLGVLFYRRFIKSEDEIQTVIENSELDKFPQTHLSDVPVPINYNGHNYDFYPEIAEDGRYKTLYQIEKGRFMFVTTIDKLKESLRTSLKKDSNLVTELIHQGRMRMKLI